MKRIVKILRDRQGASLLIVLSSMLFLITIAASTLTTALGSVSVTQTQRDRAQVNLYAQSLQSTLQGLLNTEDGELQEAILISVYKNRQDENASLYDEIIITIDEPQNKSFKCELDTENLIVTDSTITGTIRIAAYIDLDENNDEPTAQTTCHMEYTLTQNAVIETTGDYVGLAAHGVWEIV